MSIAIASALSHQLLQQPRRLLSTYPFYLGDIDVRIRIHLYEPIGGGKVEFEQSHVIKTPCQIDAYRTSRPWNDTEAAALDQVVSGFTRHYEEAVQAGHQPEASWLVVNANFTVP